MNRGLFIVGGRTAIHKGHQYRQVHYGYDECSPDLAERQTVHQVPADRRYRPWGSMKPDTDTLIKRAGTGGVCCIPTARPSGMADHGSGLRSGMKSQTHRQEAHLTACGIENAAAGLL